MINRFKKLARKIQEKSPLSFAPFVLALMASPSLSSCTVKPEPIHIGVDSCAHCHMEVMDLRFGGEVITSKGRVYKFDALSCLAEFVKSQPESPKKIFFLDYHQPGVLIPLQEAHLFKSKKIKSPMGEAIIASKKEETKEEEGERITWDSLIMQK